MNLLALLLGLLCGCALAQTSVTPGNCRLPKRVLSSKRYAINKWSDEAKFHMWSHRIKARPAERGFREMAYECAHLQRLVIQSFETLRLLDRLVSLANDSCPHSELDTSFLVHQFLSSSVIVDRACSKLL